MQILIRKSDIDDEVWLYLLYQLHKLRHIVGIHRRSINFAFDLTGDFIALRLRATSERDVLENFGHLSTFMSNNTADTAGSDNENFRHDEEVASS